jgi:hypothetical protein
MSKTRPFLPEGEKAMNRLLRMSTKEESKAIIPALRKAVMEKRNELKHCPFCSNPIADTTTSFTDHTAVRVLWELARWCRSKGRHEFDVSEVKDLLDKTQYANLNHLDRFAGIVYRPINPKTRKPYTSKWYGIHTQRADEFFRRERKAPIQITYNRFTGERMAVTEGYVNEFPKIKEFLDADGSYDPLHKVAAPPSTTTRPYSDH